MKRREFWKFLPAVPAVALAKVVMASTENPNVIHSKGGVVIQNCTFNSTEKSPGLNIVSRPKHD